MAAPVDISASLRTFRRLLLLCFGLISLLLGVAVATFFVHQARQTEQACATQLRLLGQLYARQLGFWRQQQIGAAELLSQDRRFVDLAGALLQRQEPGAAAALRERLQPLFRRSEIHALGLCDADGRLLLLLSDNPTWAAHFDPTDARRSLELAQPLFSRITQDCPDSAGQPLPPVPPHMNLIVPLPAAAGGALVVFLDPLKVLIPLLHDWPVPSDSAEIILVRQLRDQILRLTPTRFGDNCAPLTKATPPAGELTLGRAMLDGRTGFIRALDYRLTPVFAQIEPVPGSPWLLAAKIDRQEALRPLRHSLWRTSLLALASLTDLGLILLLWWRQQQARYQADFHQAERRNRLLASRIDDLSRHANDIILLCDPQGAILDGNERALESYDLSLEELRQRSLLQLCDLEESEAALLWQQLSLQPAVRLDCLQRRKDGSNFPVEVSARWIEQEGQRLLQAIIRDISERKEAEERLHHQARHDALTGLPNRTQISEQLRHAILRAQRSHTQVALLFLDLDLFKNINDSLGHTTGDALLRALARRMRSVLREKDNIGRFGGDEFLVLIEDIQELADIVLVANKLADTVAQPLTIEGRELCVTTSIGISIAPDDSSSAEQLIRFADTAMYQAKERGRNNFQFFTSDMNLRLQQRLELENDLRKALQQHQLLLHYQPQIDLRSGRIIGSEALVRWQHPQRGLIGPDLFIPLAEQTGLISDIGRWVLREACLQNRLWQQQGFADLAVAVNLSARQFQNLRLVEEVLAVLRDTGLAATALELELTESLLMSDVQTAVEQMQRLSQAGIRLAIDDFGTGYSSLNHLHRFPLDRLKVDRSFVQSIAQQDSTIARSIIVLAHELGLEVIAEGIETAPQRDFLLQHRCHFGQGYLFSPPVSAADFGALLRQDVFSPAG